ncbi:enoyl-CoA hydratase/isomerase family protein [Parafrankia sp. FMc2]|uniref:enoyl-CoA hydratase/isomerase family protein n=1 Tax=Parafrankia sp. FMc2 TaxID=3233196 RepID=UPI0034D5633B
MNTACTAPAVLEPEEALVALRADPEMFAAYNGSPLLAVRIRGPRAVEVGALARWLPGVLVGVAPDLSDLPPGIETAGFDILLTDQSEPPAPWVGPMGQGSDGQPGGTAEALAAIAAMTRAVPAASVAFTQLVRYSAHLDVRDAVIAESFVYSTLQAGAEFAVWLAGHRAARASRAAASATVPVSVPMSASASTAPASVSASGATTVPSAPAVLVDRDGDELWVELNRPQVRNAVSRDLRDGLVEAFTLAAGDPSVSAVRLRGVGPTFCSGGDLSEFGTLPDPAVGHAVRTSRSIPMALLRCADRVTAYVHGTCVGAGVEVPAFARRVVADPRTTFRLPELAMGLIPGAGGTSSIVRRVGRERTAFLSLTGWAVGTAVAAAWGLVDDVRPVSGDTRPPLPEPGGR